MSTNDSQPTQNNHDLKNDFIEPVLSTGNMDRFLVRSNILNAIKEVRPQLNGTILDLGCGKKPYRTLIVDSIDSECQYIGIDIPNALYQKGISPDIFWDGQIIPLARQAVNHVLATEVFEHIQDLLQVLNEIYRILKPGGLLFFTTPFLWPIHDAPNDEYRYTPFSLERILKRAGFCNINIQTMGGWNASMAQMIGLWVRRSPLSDELREEFSTQLFPFYKYLITSDKVPEKLTSEMYTGLYGTGQKSPSPEKYRGSQQTNSKRISEDASKTRKKLIYIVGLFPALSETFILDQITGLIDRGYEIEIWSIYGTQDNIIHSSVLEYKLLDVTHKIVLPPRELWDDENQWVNKFKQLNPFFDIQQIQAFHIQFGIVFNELIPLFRFYLHARVIVSFYGADATRYIKENGDHCYDYLFSRANLITSPSEYLRRILTERGCPEGKVIIHRCGINTRNYVPENFRSPSPKIRILTVARLVEKKGIEYSLRAIAQLPYRDRIQYHIVGEGPLREKLSNLIIQLGLSDQVALLGAKDRNQLIHEMRNTDIFLLTSITAEDGDQEGLPVSIIEAQAMELPIISTYHSGIPELVIHKKTGLLSSEKDIAGIASNIVELIENEDQAMSYSRNARKRILEEFDIEKLNDKLESYYLMESQDLLMDEDKVAGLQKVAIKGFGGDFWVKPRFVGYYTNQLYDEMTTVLLRQFAKGVNTFIDIGAHYGFFDVLVGLSNPACKIYSFEPVLENCDILKKNLALNHVTAEMFKLTSSNQTGNSSFQIPEASENTSFLPYPNEGAVGNIEMDEIQLDHYLSQIPDGPVLVKIDTEGSESKVLAGMHKLIEKFEDIRLIIKVKPTNLEANFSSPSSLLNQLEQLGFDVFFAFNVEKKYIKYIPGSALNEYQGEGTFRDVICIKKNRSLNICAFSHSSSLGGAETGLLELVDRLVAKYGVIFTIVLPSDGALKKKIEERGGAVMIIPYHWWCASMLPAAGQVNDLMLASYQNTEASLPSIERISPDVFLTNTMVIPWGALSALLLNRPHIWWVKEFGQIDHNLDFYFTFQKTIEIIKESSTHIVVNSDSVKNVLFPDLDPEKCTVAINNFTLANPSQHKETYFRYSTSTKLVIAGNVARAKGQDDAIHAVKKLLHSKHDVELCVVGGVHSSFGESLKSIVKMDGLEERIHFVDFVENIRSLIEQADISLMCSKNEAFGRVTAEAMLLGLPVIGTNTGGTVELIDDGISGFLYSPGDVNELADRITFFIEHPEKIQEFGKRAQEKISQKLAVNPADTVLLQLFQNYKGGNNPKSLQLIQLALVWQTDIKRKYEDLVQEKDKIIQALSVQMTGKEQIVQALTTQVAEREQAVQALSIQLAEKEQSVQVLQSQVADKDQAIQTLAAQVVEKEQAAQVLTSQVEEKEQTFQSLTVQLAEKEQALTGIKTSRAWKVVLILRRIRALLVPPNSRRAWVIRRGINVFTLPFRRNARNKSIDEDLALIKSSGFFDKTWYLAKNSDVTQAKMDPFLHYLCYGGFEGRDPGPNFSSSWYLNEYNDVEKAGINPLVHYLKYGKLEGRKAQSAQVLFISGEYENAQVLIASENKDNAWLDEDALELISDLTR